jgi:hypothetical protein
MELRLVQLHNILRWVILLLLLFALYQTITKKAGIRKTSFYLLIFTHIMIILGLYQLIAGRYGIIKGLPDGVELMKNTFWRFFWVEHPLMMILAAVLITVARVKAKVLNYKATAWLLIIALLLILAAIPWPFLEGGKGRSWFPGLGGQN